MGDCLYVVIPAYNEEENIESVVNDWYPVVERAGGKSRLLIVDDGSRDGTFRILTRLAQTRPRLKPVTKANQGHGATVLYGYRYALRAGADYIFQTDSDGQTVASEFWPFWKRRKKYDMIIGLRNHREDGLSRVIVTKVLKLTVLACFHVYVPDANTPFRLMSRESLAANIRKIPKNYNLSNVVLSVLYEKYYRTKYIPITFRPRQGGVNSINIPKIARIGRQAVTDFMKINQMIRR